MGATPAEGKFDWAKVHGRLDQLGCCCFQIEQQVGGCKLVCLLPTGKTGQLARKLCDLESTENAQTREAVRLAIEARIARAERWASAALGYG